MFAPKKALFLFSKTLCNLPIFTSRREEFLWKHELEDKIHINELNELLSQYSTYIIGRMGIPYHEKNVSIISIAMDAPQNIISALSGKIGMLPGISTKTIYSKMSGTKTSET